MAEEIKSAFNKSVEEVDVQSNLMHDHLVIDQAAFAANFPFVTEAYVDSFQGLIDAARAIATDAEVVLDTKVLTQNVNAQVKLGKEMLNTLNTYAMLAYPDDEARQKVFGQHTWEAARSDQEKMRSALMLAFAQATKMPYKADLAAVGYAPTAAGLLKATAIAIDEANQIQEQAKSERGVTTQTRVLAWNGVWKRLRQVNVMSKEVFKDNPAKLEQYLLYPGSETQNQRITITVYKTGTTEAVHGALVKLTNTTLDAAETNAEGKVDFNAAEFPDLLDVKISHAELGVKVYDDLDVTEGEDTSMVLEVGEGAGA